MLRSQARTWLLFTLVPCFGGCAQYAITTPNALRQAPAVVEVRDNLYSVREKLERSLRARGRLERVVIESANSSRVHLIQPWIRDSSLRYYLLDFDTRQRHVSEWKAQWTIEGLGPDRTLVRVRVLEVLFMGPPRRAKARPDDLRPEIVSPKAIDWFETDEDHLRASAELRRFWVSHYPLAPLPRNLSHLPIVALEELPTAEKRLRQHWTVFSRPRSF